MQRGRAILKLACTVSCIAHLKNRSCLDRGEDMPYHVEKSKETLEELLLNGTLYSNYLTNN